VDQWCETERLAILVLTQMRMRIDHLMTRRRQPPQLGYDRRIRRLKRHITHGTIISISLRDEFHPSRQS